MKTLKQFLNERKFYHTFKKPHHVSSVGNPKSVTPIWLAHSRFDTLDNHIEFGRYGGHKGPVTHQMKVRGKIAHHGDPKVKELFDKHNISQSDYKEKLNWEFDDTNLIRQHPATQMLQRHGYVGYHHPEAGMRNIRRPTGSTVIFNRRNVTIHNKNKTPVWSNADPIRMYDHINKRRKSRFLTTREKNKKYKISERVNYHIARGGSDPMKHKDRAIWFAHNKKLKTGIRAWYTYDNKRKRKKLPDEYTAKIKGKIAHHGDPKVKEIIRQGLHRAVEHGEYMDHHEANLFQGQENYHHTLNDGNGKVVQNHPITHLLQHHGYVGYRHPEVATGHLRDEDLGKGHPHEATVVFDRRHVSLKKQEKNRRTTPFTNNSLPGNHHFYQRFMKGKVRVIDHHGDDITHTQSLERRKELRKHNVALVKDAHGVEKTIKRDTAELHSVGDQPSAIYPNGTRTWHKDGELHRDYPKAAMIRDGQKYYFHNGREYKLK